MRKSDSVTTPPAAAEPGIQRRDQLGHVVMSDGNPFGVPVVPEV